MNLGSVRLEATKLRLRGKTYSEIQRILNLKISKGTMSYWMHGLSLPKKSREILSKKIIQNAAMARERGYVTNRNKRKLYLSKLRDKNLEIVHDLDLNTQKLLLSILYLAEGSKNKSSAFLGLGSSDPNIIKLYLKLLKNSFQVTDSKFRVRIQCRYDQDPRELENFWAKVTKIKRNLFYPTYKDKRTKGRKTLKPNYKGVCVIHYFDTSIQLELELLAQSVIKFITAGR